MDWNVLLFFIPAGAALAVAPGPNNLLAVNHGARYGLNRALMAGLGRMLAFVLMIVITAVGLGAALAASEIAFQVIKWGGAAYLAYLGIRTFLTKGEAVDEATVGKQATLFKQMRSEFIVAAGNPKAILIFTAFFPQFIKPELPFISQFFVLGVVFLIMEFFALGLYAAAGKQVARLIRTSKGMQWLNRVSGGALFSAGVALAASK